MPTGEHNWVILSANGKYFGCSANPEQPWRLNVEYDPFDVCQERCDISGYFPASKARALIDRLNSKNLVKRSMMQITDGLAAGSIRWERR
jgi:hypothetical protein